MPVEETGIAAALEKRSVSTIVDSDKPWPGLDAYDERGKEYFQGRDDVARDLLRLVSHEDLVRLYGISGLGKTSLLRAGLFPRLPPNILPVYLRLNYVIDGDSAAGTAARPASFTDLVNQVVSKLQEAAREHGAEPPSRPPQPEKGLWEYLRRADDGLWNSHGLLMIPLLVFDQFEEMFTRVESPHAAQRHFEQFLTDLAHLVSGHEPPWYEAVCSTDEALERPAYTRQPGVCKVLFSFREDYLANVKGLSRIVPSIDRIFVRLEPMTRKAATLAVAHAGGHLMGGGGIGSHLRTSIRIIRKVTVAPGRLGVSDTVDSALLSLFCKELNDKRKLRTPPVIERTLIESAETGRIFESFYARAMSTVSPVTQDFVERNLVLPGTRSRWPAAEQSALAAGVPKQDLDALAALRLIRFDVSAGIPRFELTHDVLVDVVLESRAHREEEARVERERKALEVEAERTTRRLMAQRRRTLWSLGAAGVACLLLLVATAALFNVTQLQRQQQSRMFADAAFDTVRQDVRLSTKLARRAMVEAKHSGVQMPLAEIALNTAVRSPYIRARHSLPALPVSMAINEDGSLLAVVLESRRDVQVRRGPDFGQPQSLVLSRDVEVLDFASGSGTLFIFYTDTSVDRVYLRDGDLQPVPVVGSISAERRVASAAVSRDGQHLLVSSVGVNSYGDARDTWLSAFAVGSTRWNQPEVGTAGALWALSRDGITRATLSRDGVLTATTAQSRIGRYSMGASTYVRLSADGKRLLAVLPKNPQISLRVLSLYGGRLWTAVLPHTADVTSALFSSDGTLVAVVQDDGVVSVWDVVGERALFEVPDVNMFVFSNDSEELLTWSQSRVERWSARTGQRFDRLGHHGEFVTHAATAGTSASLITIAGQELYIWDRPAVDRVLVTTHKSEPLAASISADGRLIATADPAAVHVYDESGTLLQSLERTGSTSLAFSPDGRQLAIGTDSGDVLVHRMDPATTAQPWVADADSTIRARAASEATPSGAVTALAFAPAGHLAVAARAASGVSRVTLRSRESLAIQFEATVPGDVAALGANDRSQVVVGVQERPRYDQTMSRSASPARLVFLVLPASGSVTREASSVRVPAPPPQAQTPAPSPLPSPTRTPPPQRPSSMGIEPKGNGPDCQVGSAGINAEWTLAAATTSCEPVVTHWRGLQGPSNLLNMERAVSRVAVSPVGDYVAVAFVDGAVWLYHIAYPSSPVVLQAAGPGVRWLGFSGAETSTTDFTADARLLSLRSDRTLALYAVSPGELEGIADQRDSQWTLERAECERVFEGMSTGGPCDAAGFWTTVKRTLLSALPGR